MDFQPTGGQLVDPVRQDQLSSELVAVLPGALSDGLVSCWAMVVMAQTFLAVCHSMS